MCLQILHNLFLFFTLFGIFSAKESSRDVPFSSCKFCGSFLSVHGYLNGMGVTTINVQHEILT